MANAVHLAAPANGFAGGILDLADNDLIVHGGNLSAIQSLLANGYNGGAWNDLSNFGTGPAPAAIDSATAAADDNGIEALGDAEVGQPNSPTAGLFDGQPVTNGDVVVRFTYYGDANLDGVVNSTDETAMENGETNNLTGWNNGDFDYSGVIDDNDAALLDASESFDLAAPLPPAAEDQAYSFTLPGDAIEASTEISTIQNWLIRWGDGSSTNYAAPAGSSPDVVASHTYASPNIGEYSLAIVASGSSGYGSRSHIYTLVLPHQDVIVAPDAPTNRSATESTAGEVDLTWADDTQDATGYVVTATPTAGGTTITQNYNSSTFAASFTGLTPDVTYTFSVVAVDTLSDGISAQSTAATTTATAPAATLTVTGPATVIEDSIGSVLNLSSGSSSNITSWTVAWTDDAGNVLSTDTVTGANGTDSFSSPSSSMLIAEVTAHDSSGNCFVLPAFFSTVVPTAPTGLTATAVSPTEIDLSWTDATTAADEYDLSEYIDGAWVPLDTVATPTTTYAVTGLAAETSYRFEVVADNNGVDSSAAGASATTAIPPIVAATGNATVAEGGTYTSTLTSDSSASGSDVVAGWNVDWGDGNGTFYYSGSNVTESITMAERCYGLEIVATAETAAGAVPSYAVQAAPLIVDVMPNAPTLVFAGAASKNEAIVSWQDNSQSELNIVVLRSSDGGETYQPVATLPPGTEVYDDYTVAPSSSYDFEVESVGGLGGQTTSGAVPAETPAVTPSGTITLNAPNISFFDADPGSGVATVSWNYSGNDVTCWELEMNDVTENIGYSLLQNPDGTTRVSQSITDLNPADTYNLRIRADFNDGTVSDWSTRALVFTPTTFPTLSATPSSDSGGENYIQLSWTLPAGMNASGNAVSIEYTGSATVGQWAKIDSGDLYDGYDFAAGDSPIDYNILNGQTAQFRIEVDGLNGGGWGYATSVTQNGAAGEAPGLSALTIDSTGTATTSWAPIADAVGYEVGVASNATGYFSGEDYEFFGDDTATHASFTTTPGVTYEVTVEAIEQSDGDVLYGFAKTYVSAPGGPAPASPTGLVITLTNATTVFMHWYDNSTNEDGFDIYRSTDPNFPTGNDPTTGQSYTIKVNTTGADVNQYQDTLPNTTQTFYYRVYSEKGGSSDDETEAVPQPGDSDFYAGGFQGSLALQSVQFGGFRLLGTGKTSDFQTITRDNGNVYAIDQPEWYDANTNGIIDTPTNRLSDLTEEGPTDHSWPISYERSFLGGSAAYMTATPTFNFQGNTTGQWEIEGVGTLHGFVSGLAGSFTFGPAALTTSGGVLTAVTTSQQPLPTTIQTAALVINWEVSFNGGRTWSLVPIGKSINPLFVTGGAAAGAYETVLYVGGLSAYGLRPSESHELNPGAFFADQVVAEAIFAGFRGLALHDVEGRLMKYWGVYTEGCQGKTLAAVDDPGLLAGLMNHADGQCDAWAQLLLAVFQAEGVTEGVRCAVTPKPPHLGFDTKPIPGQGNPTPRVAFLNHVVVKFGNHILFDPSYGKEYDLATQKLNEASWEATSLANLVDASTSVLGNPTEVDFPLIPGGSVIFTP